MPRGRQTDLLQSDLFPGDACIHCCWMSDWLHAIPCHPSLAATLIVLDNALLLLDKWSLCPFDVEQLLLAGCPASNTVFGQWKRCKALESHLTLVSTMLLFFQICIRRVRRPESSVTHKQQFVWLTGVRCACDSKYPGHDCGLAMFSIYTPVARHLPLCRAKRFCTHYKSAQSLSKAEAVPQPN
jgi:hypothetical protein